MIKTTFQHQRGFTLVEILIVALMIGLVIGAIYSLYGFHHRTAYIQDEVVEVQQNLRIAMDSIVNDLRHSGFLTSQYRSRTNPTPVLSPTLTEPVRTVADMSAFVALPNTPDLLGGVAQRHADSISMNIASTEKVMCKLAAVPVGNVFSVTTSECLDGFALNDFVRILNPTNHEEPSTWWQSPQPQRGTGLGTVFQVAADPQVTRAARTITLTEVAGYASNPSMYKRADMIIRIPAVNAPNPNVIQYCLGPIAGCGLGVTCPQPAGDQTLCLIKIENGAPRAIAARISGLQFTYLLDNGLELSTNALLAPNTDLAAIRAVKIFIAGQTQKAVLLSQGAAQESVRTLTTVIQLKNRYKGN